LERVWDHGTWWFATELPQNNSSRFENSKRKQSFERNHYWEELEGKLKDELLKKVCLGEKKTQM
jgi:hypothetical protein